MKHIFSLFAPLFFFAACTKHELDNPETCATGCLVSYKYTEGYKLLKVDTLWKDLVCGRWIDSIQVQINKGEVWLDFRNCPPPIPSLPEFKLEKRIYFINP